MIVQSFTEMIRKPEFKINLSYLHVISGNPGTANLYRKYGYYKLTKDTKKLIIKESEEIRKEGIEVQEKPVEESLNNSSQSENTISDSKKNLTEFFNNSSQISNRLKNKGSDQKIQMYYFPKHEKPTDEELMKYLDEIVEFEDIESVENYIVNLIFYQKN